MSKGKLRLLWGVVGVVILASCFLLGYGLNHNKQKHTGITLQVLKVEAKPAEHIEEGYGYRIYVNDTLIIDQPFIPNTSRLPFRSKKDAKKVGELVVSHMRTRGDISISTKDLKTLGIL